jgi:hypothetical protein
MSLVELKREARDHQPKIKQYYIKSRLELIQILSMGRLPDTFVLEKKTIAELRKEAIEKGIKNIWKLKRAQLMDILYPSSNKNNQDDNSTQKHENPQDSETK